MAFSASPISIGGANISFTIVFAPLVAKAIFYEIAYGAAADTGCAWWTGGSADYANSTRSQLSARAQAQLLPTVLFAMQVCTFLFAICWYTMGSLRWTRMVQYMPSFVISGFIAGVGYLTMVKAMFMATGYTFSLEVTNMDISCLVEGRFWMFLFPSVLLGFVLWATKHFHIGKPVIMLPTILCVPLVVFYASLQIMGSDPTEARANGWLLPKFDTPEYVAPNAAERTSHSKALPTRVVQAQRWIMALTPSLRGSHPKHGVRIVELELVLYFGF